MELPVGKVISGLRKKNGITQEQLAEAVGVSVPAVSKWETGGSYPDITLLMPIARYLGVTVDDLFRYKSDIPPERVLEIEKECTAKFEEEGFDAGLSLCGDYLREYPNNAYLKFRIASLLPWYADKCGTDGGPKNAALEQAAALLKEASRSEEEKIRNASLYMLACTYSGMGRFSEAREILEKLPNGDCDPNGLLPSVYFGQGEYKKAKELHQKNLMNHVENAVISLTGLERDAVREQKWEDAVRCADAQRELIETFHLEDFLMFSNCDLYLSIYSRKKDAEKTLIYLEQWLASFPFGLEKLRISDICFFSLLETRESSYTVNFTKETVLRGIEEKKVLDFIRDDARFRKIIDDFKNSNGDEAGKER